MKILVFILAMLGSSILWAEESLLVVTEEYPPLNYTDQNGELKGIAVELARTLLKEAGFPKTKIKIQPWSKAYATALNRPNTLIFTITRSERREDKFHWIGNVIDHDVYLFQSRDRKDIDLPDLEAAKKYRIGGVKLWDTTVWLTQQGIPVLELDRTWIGMQLLKVGQLDLLPHTELSLAYDAARHGLKPSDFMKTLKIRSTSSEFAMSKNSDPALVKKLRKTYANIRSNGLYQRIYDKYVYMDLYDKPAMQQAVSKP